MFNESLLLRLRYLLAFYKSTLWVTLPLAFVAGSIVYSGKGMEESVKAFLYFYSVWGLLLDALGKLCFRRLEFFFYYNASWTIQGLYAASFAVSATFCLGVHFLLKWLWIWY